MNILHILDHSLPLHAGYIFRSQRSMGYDPVIPTSPKHEESLKQKTPARETINDFTLAGSNPN